MQTHVYTRTHTYLNTILSHKVLRKIYHLYDNEMCIRVIYTALLRVCLRSPLGPDPKQTVLDDFITMKSL